MTQEEFTNIVNKIFQDSKALLATKGNDYTDGEDRLSNFKNNASKLGLTTMQVWGVYFLKHIDAITKYCATNKLESEPIDSRFLDAINYLILGYALMKESR